MEGEGKKDPSKKEKKDLLLYIHLCRERGGEDERGRASRKEVLTSWVGGAKGVLDLLYCGHSLRRAKMFVAMETKRAHSTLGTLLIVTVGVV